MPRKRVPFNKVVCFVCGDTGTVPRLYRDLQCGLVEGLKLVPCPKCAKGPDLDQRGSPEMPSIARSLPARRA